MSVLSASTAGRSSQYQAMLHAGWQRHLQPRQHAMPCMMSLFAGLGGSSLGYSMAGWQECLAVDMQPIACKSFRLNFPLVPLHEGDIAALSCQAAAALAGLPAQGATAHARAGGLVAQPTGLLAQLLPENPTKFSHLDLLDGSPPCQGFSTAGKRHFDDHRNQLFTEYVRFLGYFRPKLFVMENVPGLVKGRMRLIFADILKALKGEGYRVAVRQLNAMYYGVPQSRNRLIFIGVRDDLGVEPGHPLPRSRPYTMADAIDHIEVPNRDELEQRPHPGQRWALERIKPGEQMSKVHPNGYWYNYSRLPRDRPAPTMTTNGYDKLFHYKEDRTLSIPEMKALGSFPPEFQIEGSLVDAGRQIGNAVPPFLMKAIAEHCKLLLENASGTTEQVDARSA